MIYYVLKKKKKPKTQVQQQSAPMITIKTGMDTPTSR